MPVRSPATEKWPKTASDVNTLDELQDARKREVEDDWIHPNKKTQASLAAHLGGRY
jgi:hypothetical protein